MITANVAIPLAQKLMDHLNAKALRLQAVRPQGA